MRVLSLILLLVVGAMPAAVIAGDPPRGHPPGPFQAERNAADAVVRAFDAKDTAALGALGASATGDPWPVVEALCFLGRHDAAAAFAAVVPKQRETELLAGYVEAQRSYTGAKADRKRMEAAATGFGSRDFPAVVAATAGLIESDVEAVTRVRLLHMRSLALRGLRRLAASVVAARRAADLAAELGWLAQASALYQTAGRTAYGSSDSKSALSAWEALCDLEQRRGREKHFAGALANVGLAQEALGQYDLALGSYRQAAQQFEALGDALNATVTYGNIGNVHQARGELDEALAAHQKALAGYTKYANAGGVARTMGNIANVHLLRGNYVTALAKQEEALALQQAVGDKAAVARTLGNIGLIHAALGNYTKALATYKRSMPQKANRQDKAGMAGTLINMAASYSALGRYAEALAALNRGLAFANEVGHRQWSSRALANMGSIHFELGNSDRALATMRRSLAMMKQLGDKLGTALALDNMGLAQLSDGDTAGAYTSFVKALKQAEVVGAKSVMASALGHIAQSEFQLGRQDEAIATYRRAIDEWRALGSRPSETGMRIGLGGALLEMGRFEEARKELAQARRSARSLRTTPLFVRALVGLAKLAHQQGEPGRALSWAREALNATEDVLGGLGEEEGALARRLHFELFGLGALSAILEDDLAEALTFLESGRAGALLDILGRRDQLRWKAETLPPALLAADRKSHDDERIARHGYDRALREGKRRKIKAALAVLDATQDAVREMSARIQRELKQQAGLYYPRAKSIEDLQAALKPHQALVLYGLCHERAIAFILRRDEARVVTLGTIPEVVDATANLAVIRPDGSPGHRLAALRKLLTTPLKLASDVTQVLISPEGPLCYVPFSALFDRPIAMTPSGTTHVLLLEQERAVGQGILAIGNPDYAGVSAGARAAYYRGRPLSALPATKKEIETIGTTVLQGADASEEGLRAALAKATTWRAVHFACHGLVDAERPHLSSLVLTGTEVSDGFLTVHELRRMRIPADLVVLSACQTARGRNSLGEGVVGLARTFMHAGSPRVICSLWKVDDEATQALMLKFYELWSPKEGQGLGAAEALAKAQAHIRAQERWQHPYYWAAWMLWGLPE